jgi:hypothetical protein
LLRCARNDGGYSFAISRRSSPEVCVECVLLEKIAQAADPLGGHQSQALQHREEK